jgi:hypothetical protein
MTDNKLINETAIKAIKQLWISAKIDQIVIVNGNIFFKQIINKKTIRQSIKEKFSRTSTNGLEIDNTDRIQQTVSLLLDRHLI